MKKKILAIMAFMLCLSVFIPSTLAYFTKDDTATNVFTTSGIDVQLVEQQLVNNQLEPYPDEPISVMPGTTVSKIATVKNLQEPAYVRAKIDVTVVKQDTGASLSNDVVVIDVLDGWEKIGDWYYYSANDYEMATAAESILFEKVVFKGVEMDNSYQNCDLTVTVDVQAVQSRNNPIPTGKTVADVGGWN